LDGLVRQAAFVVFSVVSDCAAALAEILLSHGGGTGIALAWELQLLGQKAGAGA